VLIARQSRGVEENRMARAYRAAMQALYRFCVFIAGAALVMIATVMPFGVYTRYVINRAASWPEPAAILLTIVLTFCGAAAIYREGSHMRVTYLADRLPERWQRLAEVVRELVVALMALFMTVFGFKLAQATWHNTIADFPSLSVGVTYLPIPLGGAILLLFVFERLAIGPPPPPAERGAVAFE
jgi:TRAP-type C4-dicarboxylate transport system permease small subunit